MAELPLLENPGYLIVVAAAVLLIRRALEIPGLLVPIPAEMQRAGVLDA